MLGTRGRLRHLYGPLGIALAGLAVGACGGGRTTTRPVGQAAHASTPAKQASDSEATTAGTAAPQNADLDGDSDNNSDDYGWGRPASKAETSAVKALLKRYYAAAAAEDGAAACALIYSLLAEEMPEQFTEVRGSTCAGVMSKVFARQHEILATARASLKVKAVRVKGLRARVMMSFQERPQQEIVLHRERGVWKLNEPLDSGIG